MSVEDTPMINIEEQRNGVANKHQREDQNDEAPQKKKSKQKITEEPEDESQPDNNKTHYSQTYLIENNVQRPKDNNTNEDEDEEIDWHNVDWAKINGDEFFEGRKKEDQEVKIVFGDAVAEDIATLKEQFANPRFEFTQKRSFRLTQGKFFMVFRTAQGKELAMKHAREHKLGHELQQSLLKYYIMLQGGRHKEWFTGTRLADLKSMIARAGFEVENFKLLEFGIGGFAKDFNTWKRLISFSGTFSHPSHVEVLTVVPPLFATNDPGIIKMTFGPIPRGIQDNDVRDWLQSIKLNPIGVGRKKGKNSGGDAGDCVGFWTRRYRPGLDMASGKITLQAQKISFNFTFDWLSKKHTDEVGI
eukprot:CAMPEP_0168541222 /NCGR_PEP_ID=MMETSP0413-20121227/701_1 /TAXON_ID=136452 /ORGANISM="Filamoeba nolandi, Strain NC-AS-23-1" /LENGTH=358 /DNA_ID=CAMNT_0008571021 /DNA_START=59 /DNA_END=1135 /DNA_ORIENTATION=+